MHSGLVLTIAAGTFAATMAGGFAALRLRDRLHLILGFSAGAVIAVAFFDLLPQSLALAGLTSQNLVSVMAGSFFLYLVLDRVVLFHTHLDAHGASVSAERGWIAAASLSVHSFMDGLAIGFGFQASTAVGIVIAAAVLAHDFSDGLNTVNLILKNGGTKRQAFGWLSFDAVAPVMGAVCSLLLRLPGRSLSILLAAFAGFFLYIGASDLLPDSYHAHPKFLTTLMTLAGAAILYLVIRVAG